MKESASNYFSKLRLDKWSRNGVKFVSLSGHGVIKKTYNEFGTIVFFNRDENGKVISKITDYRDKRIRYSWKEFINGVEINRHGWENKKESDLYIMHEEEI